MEKDYIVKKIRKSWRRLERIFEKKAGSDIIFFTDDIVQKYAEVHRELQAVIAIVSNYREGVDVKSPDFFIRGIYKAEGGVNVDNKEIVIKRVRGVIRCYNDWNEKEKGTSDTVKEVIEEILSIEHPDPLLIKNVLVEYAAKNTNVPKEILLEKINRFAANPYGGDSLQRLFWS